VMENYFPCLQPIHSANGAVYVHSSEQIYVGKTSNELVRLL
jgi:hypothetical protein